MVSNTQYSIIGNELKSFGLISRELISAILKPNNHKGIRFEFNSQIIEALISNLHSTQRNTVLAKGTECICLTEHFLAAAALYGLDNVDIRLSEAELPFADGSAILWLDFFKQLNLRSDKLTNDLKLNQEYRIEDPNDSSRYIVLSPAASFTLTYCLDWQHPKIGKQDYTWTLGDSTEELARARTFSNEEENKILGLSGWVIGLTPEDFTQKLHFFDEPARHKALDLIGDLYLSGINPLRVGMHVVSNKGGHELNSKAAKLLNELFYGK